MYIEYWILLLAILVFIIVVYSLARTRNKLRIVILAGKGEVSRLTRIADYYFELIQGMDFENATEISEKAHFEGSTFRNAKLILHDISPAKRSLVDLAGKLLYK